jgi:hypothetical protein
MPCKMSAEEYNLVGQLTATHILSLNTEQSRR